MENLELLNTIGGLILPIRAPRRSALGTGSFARVKLVRDKRDGQHYALKIMKKDQLVKLKQVEHILNERSVLCNFRHPLIANLYSTKTSRLYSNILSA